MTAEAGVPCPRFDYSAVTILLTSQAEFHGAEPVRVGLATTSEPA